MKKEHRAALRTLPKDDRKTVRKITRYLAGKFLNSVYTEELIQDIIGMALESRARNIPFSETVGMDYRKFSRELASNVPRRKNWEIFWTILSWIFALVTLSLPLLYVFSMFFPDYTFFTCSGFSVSVPLGWAIKCVLIIVGLVIGYDILFRFSYTNPALLFCVIALGFFFLIVVSDTLIPILLGHIILRFNLLFMTAVSAAVYLLSCAMQYFAALIIAYRNRHAESAQEK